MTTLNETMSALGAVQQQAKRLLTPELAVLKAIRRVSESILTAVHTPEIEERASGLVQYLCTYPNQVANGFMDTDLTSWTENIDAGVTAVTAHHAAQGEVYAKLGAVGGLEVDITASTGTGAAGRQQNTIVAAAAEVWDFECYVKGSAYANARARMFIQWRDGASSGLGSAVITSADLSGGFVQLKLENQTAPTSTASVDVYLEIEVTTAGGTGKAWFGVARAERAAAATISDRARRMICGEWVCRDGTEHLGEPASWQQPTSQPVLVPVQVPQAPQPVPTPVNPLGLL